MGDAERLLWSVVRSGADFSVDAARGLAALVGSRERDVDACTQLASLLREIVRREPESWRDWFHLGSALLDTGSSCEAIEALSTASLFLASGRASDEASDDDDPESAELHFLLGSSLATLHSDEACELVSRGRWLGDDDDDDSRSPEERVRAAARAALREAMRRSRGGAHARAEHQLLALSDDPASAPARASAASVAALFDDFAWSFDETLVAGLRYSLPARLAFKIDQHLAAANASCYATALDAGCGTGLLGVALGDLVHSLAGCDLSENMCALARARETVSGDRVYETVRTGDLLDVELYGAASYDLIAAADVVCYFGELDHLFALWLQHLAPGGDLVFSCESLLDSERPWHLEVSGRYKHAPHHVRRVAADAGLVLLDAEDVVARYEQGHPVHSTLYLLHRPL